jgi:hypothetical protein
MFEMHFQIGPDHFKESRRFPPNHLTNRLRFGASFVRIRAGIEIPSIYPHIANLSDDARANPLRFELGRGR